MSHSSPIGPIPLPSFYCKPCPPSDLPISVNGHPFLQIAKDPNQQVITAHIKFMSRFWQLCLWNLPSPLSSATVVHVPVISYINCGSSFLGDLHSWPAIVCTVCSSQRGPFINQVRSCHSPVKTPQKLLISFSAKAKLLQWLSKASTCLLTSLASPPATRPPHLLCPDALASCCSPNTWSRIFELAAPSAWNEVPQIAHGPMPHFISVFAQLLPSRWPFF